MKTHLDMTKEYNPEQVLEPDLGNAERVDENQIPKIRKNLKKVRQKILKEKQ